MIVIIIENRLKNNFFSSFFHSSASTYFFLAPNILKIVASVTEIFHLSIVINATSISSKIPMKWHSDIIILVIHVENILFPEIILYKN